MDPDPDPGGPKIYGSDGSGFRSGSPTLLFWKRNFSLCIAGHLHLPSDERPVPRCHKGHVTLHTALRLHRWVFFLILFLVSAFLPVFRIHIHLIRIRSRIFGCSLFQIHIILIPDPYPGAWVNFTVEKKKWCVSSFLIADPNFFIPDPGSKRYPDPHQH